MLNWAKENLQVDHIATGHYARIRHDEDLIKYKIIPGNTKNRIKLLRGLDTNKDQSYFLYDLSQEVLAKVIFPLGEMTKIDTRKEAIKYNLITIR